MAAPTWHCYRWQLPPGTPADGSFHLALLQMAAPTWHFRRWQLPPGIPADGSSHLALLQMAAPTRHSRRWQLPPGTSADGSSHLAFLQSVTSASPATGARVQPSSITSCRRTKAEFRPLHRGANVRALLPQRNRFKLLGPGFSLTPASVTVLGGGAGGRLALRVPALVLLFHGA